MPGSIAFLVPIAFVNLLGTAAWMVFWPQSPRAVSIERAAEIIKTLPSHVMTVGVFVDEPIERIRELTSELQQIYHGLSASRPGGDERGQPGQDPGSAGDDDVIDADFTVG